MKALLDTSTLVAALVEGHEAHDRAFPWLERAYRREIEGMVAAHTLAELYAILTRLPVKPRLSAARSWQIIQQDILTSLEVVALSSEDYRAVLAHLSQEEIVGGVVYDALIAQAALKAGVDVLVTLNPKDFLRTYPGLTAQICTP